MTKIATEKIEWKRWIFLLLGIIVAVMVVEAGCNYKAWKYRDNATNLQTSQEAENGRQIVHCEFQEPYYVGKIRINGEFLEEQQYTMEYTFLNGFDTEETKITKDWLYPYYSEAWSPVNKKLMSITITFPDSNAVNIESIQSVTIPHFNKYRSLFVALVVGLAGSIYILKEKTKKYLHWIFIVYTLGFGLLINAGAGPKYTSWDEPVHFQSIYRLSSDEIIEWNEAVRLICESELPSVNTGEELCLMKAYMDQSSQISLGSEMNLSSFLKRDQFVYLPMALMFRFGRIAGLTFSNMYLLGRMGNLFAYMILGACAIWILKKRKILAASVLMFPTSVFQASMYTYDGIIVGMLTLAFVLLVNEAEKKNIKHSKAAIAGIVLLVLLASMIKPVYFPLLLCLLVLRKNKNRKKTVLFISVFVVLLIAILAVFFLPSVMAAINGDLMYGADTRGGETGLIAQLLSMLSHPMESIKMMIQQMLTMDNFRNLALRGMDDYLPTNLMLLNLGNLGCIKDEWSLVLIPLLILIFLVSPEKWEHENTCRIKIITGCSIFLCVIAVWAAMYLFFTPVGLSKINGVQARYFIPLMFPAGYLFWNNKIEVHIKEVTYHRIVLYGILLLMGACTWQLVILNRCC